MDTLGGKWALVTGASGGLGVELAELLAEQHAHLVLVARRTEPMEQLGERLRRTHGVTVIVEGMDLSTPDAAALLKRRIDAHGVDIEVLVNNAGYGLYGGFVGQPLPQVLDMLHLNILTMTALTHLFARDMVQRRSGHILLTASLLGFQGIPGYAAYAASKAYVLHFGEALHEELASQKVNVTVFAPGITATGFADTAGQNDTAALRILMMQPRAVARAALAAMLRRRASVVTGFRNQTVVFLNRLTPRRIQRLIMARVFSGNP